jgi:hypothetical protein
MIRYRAHLLSGIGLAIAVCVAAQAQEKHPLGYGLEAGQRYILQMNVAEKGGPRGTANERTFDIEFIVGSVDANGTTDLQATYVRTAGRSKSQGLETFYDSASWQGPVPNEFFTLAAMAGRRLTFRLSRDGSIESLSGFEEMIEEVLGSLPVQNEKEKQKAVAALKQSFSNESARQMLERIFGVYPKEPVAVGESWVRECMGSMMIPVTMTNTYTLASIDDTIVTLKLDSTIRTTDDGKTADFAGRKVDFQLEGTQAGTVLVDRKSGWIRKSTVTEEMSGTFTPMTDSGAPLDRAMPVSLRNTLTLKLIE